MKISPLRRACPLLASVAALLVLPSVPGHGATFSWDNLTGNWSVPQNWTPDQAPTGTDATDVLTFGGNVGTIGAPSIYTSTNNLPTVPATINQIILQATDPA